MSKCLKYKKAGGSGAAAPRRGRVGRAPGARAAAAFFQAAAFFLFSLSLSLSRVVSGSKAIWFCGNLDLALTLEAKGNISNIKHIFEE